MKSVEPKADLPPASSQTMLTYSALPVRRPYHHHQQQQQQQREAVSKNMTGAYLSHNAYGLPSNKQRDQRIPPLARPRGMVYQPQMMSAWQRQHLQDGALYRKRGDGKSFQPAPIKRAKPRMTRHEYHAPSQHVIGAKANYNSVTRKSARNRVPASNDGVTHYEDLRSLSSGHSDKGPQMVESIENMLEGIDLASRESEKSLAGLVDCYKKICKGNASSVHNLVSSSTSPNFKHKKRKLPTSNGNGPMVIRSFRNPQHPHAVVQYSNPRDVTASPHGSGRPPVPAPYFYSSRALPQTSDEGGARVRLTRLPGATGRTGDVILAAPGAGSISKSAGSRKGGSVRTPGPPSGVEGTRPPSLPNNTKIIDSDEAYLLRENFNVPSSTPVASTVDISKMAESEAGDTPLTDSHRPDQRHNVVTLPRNNTPTSATSSRVPNNDNNDNAGDLEVTSVTTDSADSDTKAETESIMGSSLQLQPTTLAITLSVEKGDGSFETVDFEEQEKDTNVTDDKEEVDLNANEVAEMAKESQAQKEAELAQLLEEHHQLVSHIEELEKGTGETDKEGEGEEQEGDN